MESMNLENFKAEVHRTLLSKLDLEKLSRINSSQARPGGFEHHQRDHQRPQGSAELR